MEKLIELWERFLFYLSEFWEMISRFTAQAWEIISPILKSAWAKFMSEYCQFGAVCSDGNLTWMGGGVIAVVAVSIVVLIFAVILLVRNT